MDEALRDSLRRIVDVHLEKTIEWKRHNPHSEVTQEAFTDQHRVRRELLDGYGVHTMEVKEDLPAPDWDNA